MKKAQNLLEQVLIVAFVAIVCYTVASKFDLKTLRNYVFIRPADDAGQINIEAMTK